MADQHCAICMDTLTNPKVLHKCSHVFCTDCIDQQFKYEPKCPSCGALYGKVTGNQPEGTIYVHRTHKYTLPGYEGHGVIEVTYDLYDGIQGTQHPTPGRIFRGINRTGYLPDSPEGQKVAKMLKVAFERKLVFTIGQSRTTGADGVITWNDIHHKTQTNGGPDQFGYPDPTFLDRVTEELAAKGITGEDIVDVKL